MHSYTSQSPNTLYGFQYSSYQVLYVNMEINIIIKAITQHNSPSWRPKLDYYYQNPLLTCLRFLQSALLSNLRMKDRTNFGGNWASWFMVLGVQTREQVYIHINNSLLTQILNVLNRDFLRMKQYFAWWIYIRCVVFCLTHRSRDNMADISQTTFANAFSWMKMF